jgi:sulfur relay (sulfurtransferase) complex TusBCD TusD component (DsrE family)
MILIKDFLATIGMIRSEATRERIAMFNRRNLLSAGIAAVAASATATANAGDAKGKLFVNMTTDEPHRALMALSFARKQQERGHPVTIYFNDRGVLVASVANASGFAAQQELAAAIAGAGGALLVCPMCMKHYGVEEGQLMPNARVSNPDLAGEALFADDTRTLTW